MNLQNGDVDYFPMRLKDGRNVRLFNAGGLGFLSLGLIIVVAEVLGWNGVSRFPFWWLVYISALPAAIYGGCVARNRAEALRCAVLATIGVVAPVLVTRRLLLILALFFANLLVGRLVAWAVFVQRCRHGFRPTEDFGAPYSSLRCVTCGYWLAGLSEHRCPECGTAFGRQEV